MIGELKNMVIYLNKDKANGFYLDNENDLKIPPDFLFNKAISKEYRAFFSVLVKNGLIKKSFELDENDLAEILDKVGVRMNQDLLSIMAWLEQHKFLKVENF